MKTLIRPWPIMPALGLLAFVVLFLAPAAATAATAPQPSKSNLSMGSLVQLQGPRGCLVDRSQVRGRCGSARAIMGPGPFVGSRAIALSPNGRNLYVASSGSNAIAIFKRNRSTGFLTQSGGKAGCVAVKAAEGCGLAFGLRGPNSIAISPDGRSLYATSRDSGSITSFARNPRTGALKQIPKAGCISGPAIPGCTPGRALSGPDVVTISPDGDNVYVGSFFGNAIAVFNRKTSGTLTQPTDETGCITEVATSGCAQGLALDSPEGMAVSGDGENVYVATAVSNAVLSFSRDTDSGALTQAIGGTGCIVDAALSGCTTGNQIDGANAVAVSPGDDDVYVTSLISTSLTSFSRSSDSGSLLQLPGKSGCVLWLGGSGCSPGRALRAPEGLAISPDGANVYVTAYSSGAIAVMNRNLATGTVFQKAGSGGCLTIQSIAKCAPGHKLAGASSVTVSPNGRNVYVTAYDGNAVDVFRRVTLP